MHASLLGNSFPALAGYSALPEEKNGSARTSCSSREERSVDTAVSEKRPARSDDSKSSMAERLRRVTSTMSLKDAPKRRANTAPAMPTAGVFHRRSDDLQSMRPGATAKKASSFPLNPTAKDAKTALRDVPTRTKVFWKVERALVTNLMTSLLESEGMTFKERFDVKSNFFEKQFPKRMSGEEIFHRLTYQHASDIREKISCLEAEIAGLEERIKALEAGFEERINSLEEALDAPASADVNRLAIKHFQSRLRKKRFALEETRRLPLARLDAAHASKLAEINLNPDSRKFSPEEKSIMAYILLHAPCMGEADEDVVQVVELNVKKVMEDARSMTRDGVVIDRLLKKKQITHMEARLNKKSTLDQIATRLHAQKSLDKARSDIGALLENKQIARIVALANNISTLAQAAAPQHVENSADQSQSEEARKTVRADAREALAKLRSRGTLVQTVETLLNMGEAEINTRLAMLEAERDGLQVDPDAMDDKHKERLSGLAQEIQKINVAMMDDTEVIMKRAHSAMADTMQKLDRNLTPEQASIAGYLYLHAGFPGKSDEKIAKKLNNHSNLDS